MSFSINTNIASLQAQNYLEQSSMFQAQTIGQVTSGLRIVNSGDDAAGLAVANSMQSDQAILTQGIQNANNGLATLHTIDGGLNNINTLLDRAQTLATESASGTFTGSRATLNAEFQSVLTEINRQSQSIGLNSGGSLAQSLSVFIGGGRGTNSAAQNANGSISVDLSKSAVDSQSLGLSGFSVTGNSATDIGTGSASTTVAQILAGSSTETQSGFAQFYITGNGFSGSNRVNLEVNLSGVTDVTSLATAVNAAITSAGSGGTQAATALKNANIQSAIYTDPTTGKSQLRFTSSNTGFQVQAGDEMGNALLGNVQSGTATGQVAAGETSTTGLTAVAGSAAAASTVLLDLTVNGTTVTKTVNIAGTEATSAALLADVNTGLSGTNVTASLSGGKLQFTGPGGSTIKVVASGDKDNVLGMGSYLATGASASYSAITAGVASAAGTTADVQIAVGDAQVDLGALASSATENTSLATLNAALAGNATTAAAGIVAVDNAGKIEIESNNGTKFRLNVYGDSTDAGFGFTAAARPGAASNQASVIGTANTDSTDTTSSSLDSQGTATSGALGFHPVVYGGSTQTVNLTANDANGMAHSLSINLTTANAGNIDSAITAINSALQQTNDSTLNKIVAIKDQSSGVDQVRLVSTLSSFNVTLGTTATGTGNLQGLSNGTGSTSQGTTVASATLGTGATVDISTAQNAQSAITALTGAIATFGTAQAAVGRGENNLNYAVSLAQSQSTNEAAAESAIKDANLAQEAANLTKAQILMQAGTAALAQANSAPQTLLALLK